MTRPANQFLATPYGAGGPIDLRALNAADLAGVLVTPAITDSSVAPATTAFVLSQLPVVNILHYGADPTGVADIATPLTNALAAVPATGGTLYFPRGTYLCSIGIISASRSFAVIGEGPGISIINFNSATASAAGIGIAQTSSDATSIVSGLSIVTTVDQTINAGIFINYTVAPIVNRTVTISNVDINGGSGHAHYWHFGIRCLNTGYGVIDNFQIIGKNEANPPGGMSGSNMNAGMNLKAISSDMRITRGSVIFSNFGAYIAGDSESQQFDDVTMLAVNYGWFNDDFDSTGDATAIPEAPGPRIYNSHCASYFGGVLMKGWCQCVIANNLFYRRAEGNVAYAAITFLDGIYSGPVTVGSVQNIVHGNISVGFSSGSPVSKFVIFDTNANDNLITGNILIAHTHFADFGSGAQFNILSNNSAPSGVSSSWIVNPSVNSILINNLPINAGGSDTGTASLTVNSATPNIGGNIVSSFLTANTGSTTITNFANGYIGQIITIIANDAHTTVQNNAGMILSGGANYVMSLGNTLTLKREHSTYWREMARS